MGQLHRGIVHRDVKPANIYLSKVQETAIPRLVKLGDFGVVKWGDFRSSLYSGTITLSGQQGLGTLKYMPPEQATKPKDVSVKSDIYSLGITMFELFTNQILPTVHHVYQLTQLRMQRSNTSRRLYDLDLEGVPSYVEELFSCIFDMMLGGLSGRPSTRQILGRLNYVIERQRPLMTT